MGVIDRAGIDGFRTVGLREAYTEGMNFRVVLEFDPKTDSYSAICPELP